MQAPNKNKPLDVLPVKEGVIPVDEWIPDEKDRIVTYAGKCLYIPFDKLIAGVKNDKRNTFYVTYKDSYYKNFELITQYINYFIKFYDDGELILNYLYCKRFIDSKKINPNRESMIRYLYEAFVTPTMYEKIARFVEDNYRIDLAQNKDASKQYSESLEFTNRHAKILILISTFIKFMIPIVMHYISECKTREESKNLFLYYRPLFTVVEKAEHVDLYAKLFNSIDVKVSCNENKNKLIWSKYEATSGDAVAYAEELLNKNLIVDNIFKYVFTKSIISFNSVILKTQLQYRCVKNFGITLREISDERDSEGLSYQDKLEMNTVKIDESIILLSKVNIETTLKALKKKFHIKVPKDEIEYYASHHKINTIGKKLVFYFYAKHFGGFSDLKHVNLTQYLKMMIMMKRYFQYLGYTWIPLIISANFESRINNRMIHNNKIIAEIEDTDVYHNLKNERYDALIDMGREDLITMPINEILNSQFSIVDYDADELYGQYMDIDGDELKQEMLMFENQI